MDEGREFLTMPQPAKEFRSKDTLLPYETMLETTPWIDVLGGIEDDHHVVPNELCSRIEGHMMKDGFWFLSKAQGA